MDILEYENKLTMIRTSDASYEIKKNAIDELERKFNTTTSKDKAMEQIIASYPDISDIGDHD